MGLCNDQACVADPFLEAVASFLARDCEAVEYDSRTNSSSMGEANCAESSKGLPSRRSLCRNRGGKPCERFSSCFNALTSLNFSTGTLATSSPESILMRSIAIGHPQVFPRLSYTQVMRNFRARVPYSAWLFRSTALLLGHMNPSESIYLSLYVAMHINVYLSICLSIYICLCIYLPINLSIDLSTYP